MSLAYNVLFNIHIMPVNIMILGKETMLWIFPPMLEQDEGDDLDIEDVENVASPVKWYNFFTKGDEIDLQDPDQSKIDSEEKWFNFKWVAWMASFSGPNNYLIKSIIIETQIID